MLRQITVHSKLNSAQLTPLPERQGRAFGEMSVHRGMWWCLAGNTSQTPPGGRGDTHQPEQSAHSGPWEQLRLWLVSAVAVGRVSVRSLVSLKVAQKEVWEDCCLPASHLPCLEQLWFRLHQLVCKNIMLLKSVWITEIAKKQTLVL